MPKKESINKLQKKEGRGILLTIILVIYSLFILNLLYGFFAFTIPDTGTLLRWAILVGKIPPRIPIVGITGTLTKTVITLHVVAQYVIIPLHIAIFIGILKWKKIAIYGFFLLPIVRIITFNLLSSTRPFMLNLLSALVGLIFTCIVLSIFFFAFKRKWHLFC